MKTKAAKTDTRALKHRSILGVFDQSELTCNENFKIEKKAGVSGIMWSEQPISLKNTGFSTPSQVL
jgi:hypothetical protein